MLDKMAPVLGGLELVREFPEILLEYLRNDEQMGLAAEVFQSGQIRLNMNQGHIESIEIRQFARRKKAKA